MHQFLNTRVIVSQIIFREKPDGDGSWINGGFFVLDSDVLDLIEDDFIKWESEPLETLALKNKLYAYEHEGFWHPMDTLRDKRYLESLRLISLKILRKQQAFQFLIFYITHL